MGFLLNYRTSLEMWIRLTHWRSLMRCWWKLILRMIRSLKERILWLKMSLSLSAFILKRWHVLLQKEQIVWWFPWNVELEGVLEIFALQSNLIAVLFSSLQLQWEFEALSFRAIFGSNPKILNNIVSTNCVCAC